MPSAHDLARWPALDAPAKRARLYNTFRLSPGPLLDTLRAHTEEAERSLSGLWRRDPSVWSDAPDVQHASLNRLPWLTSPVVMAHAIHRPSLFAAAVEPDGY